MKEAQRFLVFGLVVMGAVACSSEMPIGEGIGQNAGALGGVGQAPKPDGTCDVRLTACAGACRDLGSDVANCGACSNACTGADTCVSAVCTPPAPPPPDAGTLDATTDATATCAFGEDLCGGACINVLFDDKNCGGCGITCTGGTKCTRATCM